MYDGWQCLHRGIVRLSRAARAYVHDKAYIFSRNLRHVAFSPVVAEFVRITWRERISLAGCRLDHVLPCIPSVESLGTHSCNHSPSRRLRGNRNRGKGRHIPVQSVGNLGDLLVRSMRSLFSIPRISTSSHSGGIVFRLFTLSASCSTYAWFPTTRQPVPHVRNQYQSRCTPASSFPLRPRVFPHSTADTCATLQDSGATRLPTMTSMLLLPPNY